MAEKVLIEFEVNSSRAANELGRVEVALNEINDRVREAKKQLRDFSRGGADAERVTKELAEQGKTIEDVREEYTQLRNEQIRLQETGKELRREVRNQAKEFNALDLDENSIIRLRQEYRRLKAELDQLDTTDDVFAEKAAEAAKLADRINELNKSAGSFRENVGRYEDSIGSLLGVTEEGIFGVFSATTDLIGQGGLGGLSSTLGSLGPQGAIAGAAVQGLAEVSEAVIGLVDEFIVLRGETQKLTGATGDDLDQYTSKIQALSQTFEEDFVEILRAANSVSQATGEDFGRSLELIEKGLLANVGAGGEFLDQIQEYAVQVENAGGSAEDLVKIVTEQQRGGFFSDKLIDSVKELDISLKEFTDTQREALSALGDEFATDLEEGIRSGQISTLEALDLIVQRARETGADFQQLATITADVFKGAGEDAGGFQRVIEGVYNAAGNSIEDYIDTSNELVQRNIALQQSNERVSQATARLANVFGDVSGSFEVTGNNIRAAFLEVLARILEYGQELDNRFFKPTRESLARLSEAFGFNVDAGGAFETILNVIVRTLDAFLLPSKIVAVTLTALGNVFTFVANKAREFLAPLQPVIDKINEVTDAIVRVSRLATDWLGDQVDGALEFAGVVGKSSEAVTDLADTVESENQRATRSQEELTEAIRRQNEVRVNSLRELGATISQIAEQTGLSRREVEELLGVYADATEEPLRGLEALEEKQAELRAQIEERIQFGDSYDDLKRQYDAVTDRINVLEAEYERVFSDTVPTYIERLEEKQKELRQQLETRIEAGQSVDDVLEAYRDVTAEIDTFKQRVDNLVDGIQDASLAALRQEITALKQNLEQTADEEGIREALDNITAKEAELDALQSKIAKIREELALGGFNIETATVGDIDAELDLFGEGGLSQDAVNRQLALLEARTQKQLAAAREVARTEQQLAEQTEAIQAQAARDKILVELQSADLLGQRRLELERQLADAEINLRNQNADAILQVELDLIERRRRADLAAAEGEIQDEQRLARAKEQINFEADERIVEARISNLDRLTGKEEDIAERKRQLEEQLQALREENADRISEQTTEDREAQIRIDAAREELAILNSVNSEERRKLELQRLQLETQLRMVQLRAQELSSQGSLTESERAELVELRAQAQQLGIQLSDVKEQISKAAGNDGAQKFLETLLQARDVATRIAGQFLQVGLEKQRQEIEETKEAQIEALEEEYAARIEGAEGNVALQKKLEEELQQKKLEIERKAAKERKKIARKEALIQGALGVIKAIPNPLQIAFALATLAANLATIDAQQFAKGGQVGQGVPVADLLAALQGGGLKAFTGTTVRGRPNISLANGDNMLATVRIGEKVLNKQQQKRLEAIAGKGVWRRIGLPGFAAGGQVGGSIPQITNPTGAAFARLMPADIEAIQEATREGMVAGMRASQSSIRQAVRDGSMEGTSESTRRVEIIKRLENEKGK